MKMSSYFVYISSTIKSLKEFGWLKEDTWGKKEKIWENP